MGIVKDEDVKSEVKGTAQIMNLAITIKPSECVQRNYGTITKNAVDALMRLYPELKDQITAWLNKFTEVQEAVKKAADARSIEQYLDIWAVLLKMHFNLGLYAALSALQAMETVKMCSESDARFFITRVIMAGAVPFDLYLILLDYLGMDRTFPLTLYKALLESE